MDLLVCLMFGACSFSRGGSRLEKSLITRSFGFVENYKRTSGFTPAIKNAEVPDITNYEDLPGQFGLTSEE